MKYHQVTKKDKAFAEEITRNINNRYPAVAKVIDGHCVITEDHYKYCREYVLLNCRIITYKKEEK